MCNHYSRRTPAVLTTVLFALGLIIAGSSKQPSQALPIYARRYEVTCDTCHTVAPRLNSFGLAFQANHFNWPGGHPPAHQSALQAFPISGLTTFSQGRLQGEGTTPADFRTLELFVSDGFLLNRQHQGGYFVDDFGATKDVRAGDLEDAFVSIPVAGRRGQWSLTGGQFSPMMYQYDPINSLTQSLPAALADSVDAFSFTDTNPGVRLDYFNNQGRSTADGDHLTLGVPFLGHLTLNRDSRLYGPGGVFAHAFRRHGPSSLGVFGFGQGSSHLEGVLGTYDFGRNISLLGIGAVGRDRLGSTHRFSLEANYLPNSQVALSGRLEALGGSDQQSVLFYPVVALTYSPFHQSVFRLTGEAIGQKGNRSETVFAFVQF